MEDPFFVVKDEVCKVLNKTRGLYQRWLEIQEDNSKLHGAGGGGLLIGQEDLEWTSTELRNALRSIEWDLEDLEETIGIVERNPKKFRIDNTELSTRRNFIEQTKAEVELMKHKINIKNKKEITFIRGNFTESPFKMPQVVTTNGNTRYSRLVNETESPTSDFIHQTLSQQQMIMEQQDVQLDHLSSSMGNLKDMSLQIGIEVDEQAIMLDEFGHEMEHTHSKMENTLNKMAKVMRLNNDNRQWTAIIALTCLLIVVIIILIFL